MAGRLKCPQCATLFSAPAGGDVECPNCHYRAPTSTPTMTAAGPSMGMAFPPGAQATPAAPVVFQSGYGQPTPKAHWASILSLVMGILSFAGGFLLAPLLFFAGPAAFFLGGVFGVLAIVFGAMGMNAAKANPATVGGRGMAVAGLVLGIVNLALTALTALLMFLIIGAIFGSF